MHKEGKSWILGGLIVYLILFFLFQYFHLSWSWLILLGYGLFYILILNFFRNPNRKITAPDNTKIFVPADGKVVVIEEVEEPEYFKDRRLQVSVFMNPLNVHVNRYPVSGKVVYSKYHPGKFLVAWHPKSSTENERTTVVIEKNDGTKILMRQIAGALAKRICCYAKENDIAVQGEDMGFIKFGSRVDLFLPLNTKINVQLEQVVKGNIDVIGEMI